MKRIVFLLMALFIPGMMLFSQIERMKDVMDDEMDTENFTLHFFNALDGKPIEGAAVEIDGVGLYKTDFEGKLKFPRTAEDGDLAVHFTAEGYIPTSISVEVVAGTIFGNRISISPVLAMGYFRVILDWGRNPADLDAHFTKDKQYHISFRNMKVSEDGVAKLDRDDTDSWGPETITVKEIDSKSHYMFWVQDYSNRTDENSKKLSKSGASVKVYGDGKLLEYVTIPKGDRGNKWSVFEIKNGKIELTNYITAEN